jgi:DNA (cytosine-5)-methyltransferase 1
VRPLRAIDMFCGAGGTSTGLAQAAEGLGRHVDLLAINHWPVAVETHAANHPGAEHLCASLEQIDPRKAVPGRRVDLLVASPECTHHSTARGGKPINDQSRASAWHILHWATELRIDNILIENVPEFTSWGPIGANGRPLKSRKGETFSAFIQALVSLNYRVEYRILNAADYGDPTTRRRLFILARRGTRAIRWPEPSHANAADLFGDRVPWRAAREIIDWSHRGESIFTRKRPLAARTIERIAEGLRRFGGEAAEPFLVLLRGTGTARSLDAPLPAITAQGTHLALAEPFLVPFYGERAGQGPRAHSLEDPVPTIPASAVKHALVEPFMLSQQSGGAPRAVSEPAPTVATKGAISLVEPFLVSYHGRDGAKSLSKPTPTLTTRDRLGLVEPAQLDILFRMLQPNELAAAMSFPADYEFTGNKTEIVKQVGNAVPVRTAEALCRALLEAA